MEMEEANWKDMLRAASVAACTSQQDDDTAANLSILQNHLKNGVDPNFQHPDYMTTPLIEAIRMGNSEAVKRLLGIRPLDDDDDNDSTRNAANSNSNIDGTGRSHSHCRRFRHHPNTQLASPTLASDLDGSTPLQVAMKSKHHGIVDILLQVIKEGNENHHSSQTYSNEDNQSICDRIDILAHFLALGHRVLVGIQSNSNSSEDDELESFQKLHVTLQNETGNTKLWFQKLRNVPSFLSSGRNLFGTHIHVWLHKVSESNNLCQDVVTCYQEACLHHQRRSLSRILLLVESACYVVPEEPARPQQLAQQRRQRQRQQLAHALSLSTRQQHPPQPPTSGNTSTFGGGGITNRIHHNGSVVLLAMLEPSTWWDKMTYGMWYQTWVHSMAYLLGLNGTGTNHHHHPNDDYRDAHRGKLYTYNRQCVVLQSTFATTASSHTAETTNDLGGGGVGGDWTRQLESILWKQ